MRAQPLSHVQLFVTPWTVAHQGPLFTDFPSQECWSGLPFPSCPRDHTCLSYVSWFGSWSLFHWATWEALDYSIQFISFIILYYVFTFECFENIGVNFISSHFTIIFHPLTWTCPQVNPTIEHMIPTLVVKEEQVSKEASWVKSKIPFLSLASFQLIWWGCCTQSFHAGHT